LKKYIFTAAALLIAMIGAAYLFLNKGESFGIKAASGKSVTNPKLEAKAKADIQKSFETVTPNGQMPDYEKMSDQQLIKEVHGMTHQKVEADQKWGSSEITKDKVLKLYETVQRKEFSDDGDKEMLLSILEPWTHGDFSNAVTAHNEIWSYLHGTVGKATRLLTAQEEKEYIKQKF
jgi:preprotein translocase subunit SecF